MTSFSKLSQMVLEICIASPRGRISQTSHAPPPHLTKIDKKIQQEVSHIQLDDPQQRDEEQVEGNKKAKGASHVRDELALGGWRQQQVRGRQRRGV